MSKSKVKRLVFLGISAVLLLLAASAYAMVFNESRLVNPTDFSSFTFSAKDLPMVTAIVLFQLYIVYLFFSILMAIVRKGREEKRAVRTRKLNPKLGLLGFLGFLGLAGFWTYRLDGSIFPFCFFIFFGFFGFFFEGKMSNTLMDERFQENMQRAQLKALKLGFTLMFALILLVGQGRIGNLDFVAAFLLAGLSLIYALTMVLTEYLLYRYDHEEDV